MAFDTFWFDGLIPGFWHNLCLTVDCNLGLVKIFIDNIEIPILNNSTMNCNHEYLRRNLKIFGPEARTYSDSRYFFMITN